MAIEFKLVVDPGTTVYRVVTIASQAYAVGDCVQWSRTAADVTPATATTLTANVAGVAMEAQTSAATSLLICLVTDRQLWSADNAGTALTADEKRALLEYLKTL